MNGQHEGPGAANAGALSQIAAAQAALSSRPIIPSPRDTPEGQRVADHVDSATSPAGAGQKLSITKRLLNMAESDYDVFRSREGRVYAMRRDEPGWALEHSKGGPFMAQAKERFYRQDLNWPSAAASAALADRVEGLAMTAPAREVSKRCAYAPGRICIDMGDEDRRVIVVTADGFHVTTDVPDGVLFERTAITAAMPKPADAPDLDALYRLVPVEDADRPLLLALLLMTWFAGLPCPVVLMSGPPGAGKTTTQRYALSLVDPVIIDRGGSLPTTEDAWKARLTASHCIMIDNLSGMTPAVSDQLCVVATGGEASTRTMYTNSGLHVTNLLAPVWLTSIDVGALRGDLGSRMVRLELRALDSTRRRVLSDLLADQEASAPGILRALLDLLVEVLRRWPSIDRAGINHRMTDFAIVVRCIDQVLGTNGEARLGEQADDLAGDVLATDVLARALLRGVDRDVHGVSEMQVMGERSPRELLAALTWWVKDVNGGQVPQGWPRTEGVMSGHLRRIAPALEAVEHISITWRKSGSKRFITISRTKS